MLWYFVRGLGTLLCTLSHGLHVWSRDPVGSILRRLNEFLRRQETISNLECGRASGEKGPTICAQSSHYLCAQVLCKWYGIIFEVWVHFLNLVTYSRCILHVWSRDLGSHVPPMFYEFLCSSPEIENPYETIGESEEH